MALSGGYFDEGTMLQGAGRRLRLSPVIVAMALIACGDGNSATHQDAQHRPSPKVDSAPRTPSPTTADTLSAVQVAAEAPGASELDTIPLRQLIPRRNVSGMLFDYDGELMDFHLEDRGGSRSGAYQGLVGRWETTGEFNDSAMLRLFRYRTSDAAQKYRDQGYVREGKTLRDTTIAGRKVRLITGVWHNERYSTISMAIVEWVSGRTEVEVIQQETAKGFVTNTEEDERTAKRRAIALFEEVLKQAENAPTAEPASGPSPAQVARQAQRRSSLDSLLTLLEDRRTASLPSLPPQDYHPKLIPGFRLVDDYPPNSLSLSSMKGAESGWMSEWTATASPYGDYHDLLIDVYEFEPDSEAPQRVAEDLQSTGSPAVLEVQGLPVLMSVRQTRPNSADVLLGYQQPGVGILITVAAASDGTVDSARLRQEAREALAAILRASQGESSSRRER